MDTVKLRNGAVESAAFVALTRATLDHLATAEPVTLYELWACAKDRNHKPWGNTGDTLKRLKLLPLHDTVRNIVLSAVVGEGMDISLRDPRA